MKIEGKTALAMALFVVAVFMLASKFMLPTTVQVIIKGQSTDTDRSAHGIRQDEPGGPLSPNWDTFSIFRQLAQ